MKNNKGFSLVELIIVIAIMAILVGVMAPQLIKYIEKSKVASDENLLNGLEVAIATAVSDPDVNDDPASDPAMQALLGMTTLEDLESYNTSLLYQEILSTLGWPDLTKATYMKFIKSNHTSAAEIRVTYVGSFANPVKMWITTTDSSGNKVTSYNPSSITDADFVKCVHIN